jgi:peptidoglycan/xylan/chitin deacetylase (PgdA/CDA1 family)
VGRLDTAARGLDRTGLGRLLRRVGAWRGTLVLNYHRIGDAAAADGDRALFSATREELVAQLELLTTSFEVVGVEEALDHAAWDRAGRRVLLTFDDGYRDNVELALPVLRDAGVPAVFFLATGFLDAPRHAWWDEIAWMVRRARGDEAAILDRLVAFKRAPALDGETVLDALAWETGAGRRPVAEAAGTWMGWADAVRLLDAGMDIGGHTVDHHVLARLPEDHQRAQVAGCAARLREELGIPMRWFSYPVGTPDAFDGRTQAIVRDAGVEAAFAFSGGFVRRDRPPDRLAVPRAAVGPAMTAERFAALVTLPQAYARW